MPSHPTPVAVVLDPNGGRLVARPADHLAIPVARDGDPLPVYIEETEKNFAIGWTRTYCIDGKAFVYSETESGGVRAILGYPIRRIIEQTGS